LRLPVFIIAVLSFASFGCNLPVLESAECLEARDAVKRFYSRLLDDGASGDRRDRWVPYVTEGLARELSSATGVEYFTKARHSPTSFRVGDCRSLDRGRAALDVILLWRHDESSRQSTIQIAAERVEGRWVIARVAE
jgi:hypothetical protein